MKRTTVMNRLLRSNPNLPVTRLAGLALVMVGMSALLAALPAAAFADPIKVFVDGDRVHFQDVGPQEISGRIMVPVRGVLEKMGAAVDWTPETQRVNASNGDVDIVLHIGNRTARVNGKDVEMDVPAQTMGGHTMVPLRFLSESLGSKVMWDASEATVYIMSPAAGNDSTSDRPRHPHGDRVRDPNRPRRDPGAK